MEIWKDIKSYEGLYKISNLGRVKSKQRNGTQNKVEWNIIKTYYTDRGYIRVTLRKNDKPKTYFVHRLMLITFVSEPPTKIHQTNHKNGIKDDNRIENLEWVTPSENKLHSFNVLNEEGSFKGRKHSEESKQKMRDYRIGKTSPGCNHSFITINDISYKGIRVACRKLNLNRSVLMYNIKKEKYSFTSKGVFYKIGLIKV